MVERTTIIKNKQGIHCRPSTVILKEAMAMPCQITLISEEGLCDCKSIMGLLSLGLASGTEVTIRVEGENEAACCDRLVDLFGQEFDFLEEDG